MKETDGPVIVTIELTGSRVGPRGGRRVSVAQGRHLRFESPHGKVTFSFPSPLGDGPPFFGQKNHLVEGPVGVYLYRCGITTPAGKKFGWPERPDDSDGGEVEVVKRGT